MGIGNWALGIGNGALGMGHWVEFSPTPLHPYTRLLTLLVFSKYVPCTLCFVKSQAVTRF
ncbi:hypothetical protein [Nostoc sp. CMAA1605]|uniref:hypothetical protein n=1 Tax=Nostoc sp. CMAA1605 TaxID=2055159 RepID=UPI001F164A50|nr:hypothetical protein [Nostoc sp. CMAA1605]